MLCFIAHSPFFLFISLPSFSSSDGCRYDALTILNQVHWQNGLTLLNVPFFTVTDGIFTNYGWRQPHLHHTALMSKVFSRPSEVYAGIDCFGRGSLGDGGFGVGQVRSSL